MYIQKTKGEKKMEEEKAEGGDRDIKKLKRGFRWERVPVAMERQ